MNLLSTILAESDTSFRFIFIGIVVVLWIFGAIGKALGQQHPKVRPQDELRRTREAMQRDQMEARARAQVAPQVRLRVPPAIPVARKIKKTIRAAPVHLSPMQQVQTRRPAPSVSTETPVPVAPKPISPVSSPELRKWLRPETLRQQFILTEIFQKPLSLREQNL